MTDLLDVLPSFPVAQYTHLLPSLEKHLVTTSDLLTLDGIEVAKRAQLPLLDVKRLISHVLTSLQAELGIGIQSVGSGDGFQGRKFADVPREGEEGWGALRTRGDVMMKQEGKTISLGDEGLDTVLGGSGVPTRYLTEVVGESGAAKTQILLVLLLIAQLPPPHGLGRPTLYISTEHSLPTTRLTQLLTKHPLLSSLPANQRPSLTNILSISTPDLESQDHIINYQLPVALQRHKIGLVVIDSIAANYRAEKSSTSMNESGWGKGGRAEMLVERNAQLVVLGARLRRLAREFDCAVVVANQVSDRFASLPPSGLHPPSSSLHGTPGMKVGGAGAGSQRSDGAAAPAGTWSSSPLAAAAPGLKSSQMGPPASGSNAAPPPEVMSLDHQLRWFSGWGDDPGSLYGSGEGREKNPAMGLTWANQIDCRLAVMKEQRIGDNEADGTAEWAPRRWGRFLRCVFSGWAAATGEGSKGLEFEVWEGGVRAINTN